MALVHGVVEASYRKTAELINRVRHQAGATPARTLQEAAEAEGTRIAATLWLKADAILQRPPQTRETSTGVRLRAAKVERAIASCPMPEAYREKVVANPVPYEEPTRTVAVSVDDVGVRRQKPHRGADEQEAEAKAHPAKVMTTVAHIQHGARSYTISGPGLGAALRLVMAFLVANGLLSGNVIVFADGHRPLHQAITKALGWIRSMRIILDWYHLRKKCAEQLSSAMNGAAARNEALERVTHVLWYGLVDEAIAILKALDPSRVKNPEAVTKLIESLERNRGIIPCYAVRKQLGLRNSSQTGEKANDLIVSDRQKHNGMSWSVPGSGALASLTTLIRNREHQQWFRTGQIDFRMAA